MPKCKNDSSRSFKGTEPSPKGLGYCAHTMEKGTKMKGLDGNQWIINTTKNGIKRWVKYNKKIRIIVSYGWLKEFPNPDYNMISFPKTWKYTGWEGALKRQPKYVTNNAYFSGSNKDIVKAKKSIDNLYKKYKKNKYISKFSIKVQK